MQILQLQKIYLDTCCLNRFFNPQLQARIRQETRAIDTILLNFDTQDWYWIASSVLRFEINQTPDLEKRAELRRMLRRAHETILAGAKEIARSEALESLGFKHYDALHIACAESGGADVLLTTDDRMLRLAKRHSAQLHVRVENPYTWLQTIT